jgi:hypothetical protein
MESVRFYAAIIKMAPRMPKTTWFQKRHRKHGAG